MDVVWRLRRTPERQLAVRIEIADRRMLLHRQVGVALVEESVLANQVGFGKTFLDVAKFQRDFLVYVPFVAVFMYARLVDKNCFFDRGDGVERFVLDFDEIHRIESGVFVNRPRRPPPDRR